MSISDLSQSSSRLDSSLGHSVDERVVDILDQYLVDVDQGKRPEIASIIANNADLAAPLREAFESLELLQVMHTVAVGSPPHMPADKRLHGRLDDFELGEEIGRGAAGIVYSGRQISSDRPVAVKVLAHCSLLNSDRIQRFYREVAAVALLDHPHIVSVIGVGHCDGTHYYAMNRIEGASLDRRIEAAQNQTDDVLASVLTGEDRFRRIALFMADAAEAIGHAHDAGIVHRDVKPSNLLLTNDGHVWVADFGLARIGREGDLTRSGDLVGTIRYMSPEQASGRSELIDARSDIYGLGATLYELVTLTPPFEGNDNAGLLRAVQTSEPPAPRSIDPSIPKPLEIIIRRSLRRMPSERFGSANELAADLRRFAAGAPIHASHVTWAERWAGYVREHSGAVAGACVLAFVVIAASVTHSLIVSRQQSETERLLKLSQANYAQARNAVDTLGAEFASRLIAIPEAAEVRQELLAETLSYYETFIADANDDSALLGDVARTRLKVAQLIRSVGNAFTVSENAYLRSIDALRHHHRLAADPEAGVLLVQALNELVLLRSDHGDPDSVDELLLEATNVCSTIKHDVPRALAEALTANNRGVIALRRGDDDAAKEQMNAAVARFESVSMPANDRFQNAMLVSDLAAATGNLASLMSEAGQKAEATVLATKSVELNEHLMEDAHRSASDLRRLALAHNNLAAMCWRAGDNAQAIKSYARAVTLFDRASSKAPGLTSVRRELAVALNNQGMALSSIKHFEQAEAVFYRAVALAKTAADADPDDATAAREYGGILNNLGVLLREQGKRDDAKTVFAQAMEHQKRAGLRSQSAENDRFFDQIRHNFFSVDG